LQGGYASFLLVWLPRSATLELRHLSATCCHVPGQAAAALHLPAFIKVDPSNLDDAVRDVGKTLTFLFHVVFILVDIDHQYHLSTLLLDLSISLVQT
jgi:hypothetical protein